MRSLCKFGFISIYSVRWGAKSSAEQKIGVEILEDKKKIHETSHKKIEDLEKYELIGK